MTIWSAILWSFGAAYGFVIAAALFLAKGVFLEPLFEALLEWRERSILPDPIEERLAKPQEGTRSETFIISDMHIDTWDVAPTIEGKTHQQDFWDFIDTIKATALELYINGDLVDMPPNPKEEWVDPTGTIKLKQSLLPKYAPVFEKLAEFNNGSEPTMTMYMAGNHDMAASGVRYLLHHNYGLMPGIVLPFQSVWYGSFIISAPYSQEPNQAAVRYFVEHGHYHDPVLILYLLQFVVGVVSSNLQAAMDSLAVGGQRRSSHQATPPRPGIVTERLPEEKETFMHTLVRWRWRWHARHRLGAVNKEELEQGHEPLDGILMGHTHLPDFYVYRLGDVRGKVYVNTGDWSGYTGHATYAVMTDEGLIHLYDWRRNPAPHHRDLFEQENRQNKNA